MASMPTRVHTRQQHPHDEVILGVDTHKDAHVAAVLTPLGAILATQAFRATSVGYGELLAWATSFGRLARAGVEGTGSYGAALTRLLLARWHPGLRRQPARQDRQASAGQDRHRRCPGGRTGCHLRQSHRPSQERQRAGADRANVQTGQRLRHQGPHSGHHQLKAVVVSADPALREHLAPLANPALIRACADMTSAGAYLGRDDVLDATLITLQLLAERIQQLTAQVNDLKRRLATLVQSHAPQLVERIGIGPDSAITRLVTAGDNPERLVDEASFAGLCGASPVERLSGKQQRRRLNRGGDRQANAAHYRIVQSRLRWDPRTQACLDRRIREGKTRREVIRCLKRYVAREIFSLLPPTELGT